MRDTYAVATRTRRRAAFATTAGLQFALELGAPIILSLGVAALVVANAARRRVGVATA